MAPINHVWVQPARRPLLTSDLLVGLSYYVRTWVDGVFPSEYET